jgi:HD-GYP domain-containing protein (c-di-GMP phosphodiesterase class II)
MERLFLSAFFHDIGKSVVPKHVIDKPGKLTPDEIRLVRSHVTVGYEMLRRFPETAGEIADVALYHHEMLDGSGYPNGLKGGEISDLIRLVTICDVFAALIERRSYKPPMPAREAYGILQSMGPKLDQALVAVFGEVVESLA